MASDAHARRQRRYPRATVIEPSIPSGPHYLSPWLARRVGRSAGNERATYLRGEILPSAKLSSMCIPAGQMRFSTLSRWLKVMLTGCVEIVLMAESYDDSTIAVNILDLDSKNSNDGTRRPDRHRRSRESSRSGDRRGRPSDPGLPRRPPLRYCGRGSPAGRPGSPPPRRCEAVLAPAVPQRGDSGVGRFRGQVRCGNQQRGGLERIDPPERVERVAPVVAATGGRRRRPRGAGRSR